MIDASILSLKQYYGEETLKKLSISWIDKYLPWSSNEELLWYFEKFFNESASLFDINNNVKRVAELLSSCYYHNEAYVKSCFIDRMKNNNSISFFELPIGDSRADLCSINGHSTAYEIKTKYDSLNRLEKQLRDYSMAFDYIYVVCSSDKTSKVLASIPDFVGVYEYDDNRKRLCFTLVKEAYINHDICAETQMKILRKNEKPGNSDTLSSDETNKLFKKALKDRYRNKWNEFCKVSDGASKLDYQYIFNRL